LETRAFSATRVGCRIFGSLPGNRGRIVEVVVRRAGPADVEGATHQQSLSHFRSTTIHSSEIPVSGAGEIEHSGREADFEATAIPWRCGLNAQGKSFP